MVRRVEVPRILSLSIQHARHCLFNLRNSIVGAYPEELKAEAMFISI